jgi:Phospholipase_D-nuclease N-terminal
MSLAYDYPLLGFFWTMLYFFVFFIWILLLFRVFVDIFRSHDMGGFIKACWFIFVVALPFLGVFVYLIVRGHKMAEHAAQDMAAQDAAAQAYIRQAVANDPAAK